MITFPHSMVKQHIYAFLTVSAVATILLGFVTYDRRDPLVYIDSKAIDDRVALGESVVIKRTYDWRRRCGAVVAREFLGADNIVRAYEKTSSRIPAEMGVQTGMMKFKLPTDLPHGKTVFRSVYSFNKCGLTSILWPIDIELPDVEFEVVEKGN